MPAFRDYRGSALCPSSARAVSARVSSANGDYRGSALWLTTRSRRVAVTCRRQLSTVETAAGCPSDASVHRSGRPSRSEDLSGWPVRFRLPSYVRRILRPRPRSPKRPFVWSGFRSEQARSGCPRGPKTRLTRWSRPRCRGCLLRIIDHVSPVRACRGRRPSGRSHTVARAVPSRSLTVHLSAVRSVTTSGLSNTLRPSPSRGRSQGAR